MRYGAIPVGYCALLAGSYEDNVDYLAVVKCLGQLY